MNTCVHQLSSSIVRFEPSGHQHTESMHIRCQDKMKNMAILSFERMGGYHGSSRTQRETEGSDRNLFTYVIGAWPRTCPPIERRERFDILLFPIAHTWMPFVVFLVTNLLCQDWVIFAPQAPPPEDNPIFCSPSLP